MDSNTRLLYQPDAKEIINSASCTTLSMAEQYRLLQDKTGLDFSATIALLETLPVFLDGTEHKNVRRQTATAIAAHRRCHEAAVQHTLAHLVQSRFNNPGDVDLVAELAAPLWRSIASQTVGDDDDVLDLVDAIPQLFCATVSIRRRVAINLQLESLVTSRRWDASAIIRLMPAILGARPFVGSMAWSIYNTIASNPGRRASVIDWPVSYAMSSLRFVDRVCQSPMTIGGDAIATNQRLRCVIHDAGYTSLQNEEGLYGSGAHLCLGKSIAQFSWLAVTAALRESDRCLTSISIEMDKHTEPFLMPISAMIRVEP